MELTFRTAGIGDLELLTESRLRAIRTYRHLSETAALPHGLPDAVRDYTARPWRPAATLRFWRWRESGWPPPAAWTSAGRSPSYHNSRGSSSGPTIIEQLSDGRPRRSRTGPGT